MAERTVLQSIKGRQVISLGPDASVFEAACLMTQMRRGSVLVMTPPDTLLGIVTERDLMVRVLARARDPQQTRLHEVMTPNPQCVSPAMPVSEAVVIMIERGFRHLPIAGPGGHIVGVFSARDALPREIDAAVSQAEFNEQVNDALG